MRTIKFDGTRLISMTREEDGQVNLYIKKNTTKQKIGDIKSIVKSKCDFSDCDCKIEISNSKTFLAFVKCAMGFLDKKEFVECIREPIENMSCWEIKKSNKKEYIEQ